MKKRLTSFEEYLSNVYRKDNGKPLKKSTIQDYLYYCGEAGPMVKLGKNGLYKINSVELAMAYFVPVELVFASRYQDPDTAINGYKAYVGFLEYQNGTC